MLTAVVVLLLAAAAMTADGAEIARYYYNGSIPYNDADFFLLPFEVVAGTAEIRIVKSNLTPGNVLDFGLEGADGSSRGWSGGSGRDIVVGEFAASQSYHAAPLETGTWHVVVGKAKIEVPPGEFQMVITLSDQPTLAPQPERSAYVVPPALSNASRWYAGDFHVHSEHSDGGGDYWSLDEIGLYARDAASLDFAVITDHNTASQNDFMNDAQSRFADFLFVPGNEFTTYRGHMNGFGTTEYVDHKIGFSTDIHQAAAHFHAMGAAVSINHWEIDFGFVADCVGCEWEYTRYLPMAAVDAMEVGIGNWVPGGWLFSPRAVQYWDTICAQGSHLTPVGGSDYHSGDAAAIGSPTTMVFAEELSVGGIAAAVKGGRTVLKFTGRTDPMIDMVYVPQTNNLTATITGAAAGSFIARFVYNGTEQDFVEIDADPFVMFVQPPVVVSPFTEDRWRAEVFTTEAVRIYPTQLRSMTSNLYFTAASSAALASTEYDNGRSIGRMNASWK